MADGRSTKYQAEREAAVKAAQTAAAIIRRNAGFINRNAVREKGIHDLVTDVDEAVQVLIVQQIHDAFPDDGFLAEEGADLAAGAENAEGRRWIIDPIDGTTNFLHGIPPYAVSIALQEGADIVVGVVLDASRGDLFTATRGAGAYLNGDSIQVSRRASLGESLLTTGFPFRAFGHVDAYLDVLKQFFQKTRGVRRPGVASIDLAYVAAGRFDAFFETGLYPWDVAAGLLLVEEAGGRVTDYRERSNPLFRRQVLASNGLIHAAMLEVLYPMRDMQD